MKEFVEKPVELDFLVKYSQAIGDEEKKKIKDEYDKQVQDYFEWMKKAGNNGN
jgi:hypothetical protein